MMSNLEEHLLNSDSERLLRATYEENNYAAVNGTRPAGNPDSLTCSFDLGLMQQYLDYVRNEAQEREISNVKITVCFAQYPDYDFDPRLNPAYKGYQTVLLRAGRGDDDTPIAGISALNFGNLHPPY